jgi:hypothetical protein
VRLKPYADRPARLLLQVGADLSVLAWILVWIEVGRFVRDSITAVSSVGYSLESGADGIGDHLAEAGRDASEIPLVGDRLSTPLESAGEATSRLAGAGQELGDSITTAGTVAGLVVTLVPVLSVVLVWAALRWRFARRAADTATLTATPAGRRLLALRALAAQPLHRLTRLPGEDPAAAWIGDDPATVRALAALETRRWGVRMPQDTPALPARDAPVGRSGRSG